MYKSTFISKIIIMCFVIAVFWNTALASEKPEIFVQLGHSKTVTSVAFSPDSRYALSGSEDNTMKLWEITTGREIRTFTGPTDDVYSIAFSPDGKFALSGSKDGTMQLWYVATGKEIRTFIGHTIDVYSVAFSPDGRHALSGAYDKTIRLWDIETGKEIRTFTGHTDYVYSVIFSPDGKYALSGSSDNTLKLWNIATGKEIKTFKEDQSAGRVLSVAFSPDGKYALSGKYDGSLGLWEISTGKEVRNFKKHKNYVASVSISPDGKYALSGSSDNTLKLWDIATGKEIRTFTGHVRSIYSMAISPDGKYALSGSENNVFKGIQNDVVTLWEVSTGNGIRTLIKGTSSNIYGTPVAFSPDGRYALSGSKDGAFRLWEVATGKEIRIFAASDDRCDILSVAFSPDGNHAWSQTCNTLKLWDIATGKEIKTFISRAANNFNPVVFSPDGKYILGRDMYNQNIHLWETATGKEIRKSKKSIGAVAFSPDSKYVLGFGVDSELWDIATDKTIRKFSGRGGDTPGLSVAFSPDGRHALSGSYGKTLKLWDIATGEEIRTFTGHEKAVSLVYFSPDGKYAFSGSNDGTIRLWDISTGKEIVQFIAFTDGEWIVITLEGYYNASPNGDKHLNVRIGNNVYGIENYREAFFRPDLVKVALSGGSLKDFKTLADVKQPPVVLIVNTPESINKDEATVTLNIVDSGGGIGDIRLYLNGSAVILDSSRGVKITTKDDRAVYKTYNLKLSNGLNTIRAIAFNAENTMQSNDAVHEITASFKSLTKPSLNALIIGINEYKNPKLQLKYAVSDAELFENTLKKVTEGFFEKVNIKKLVIKENTTNENIIKELKAYKSLNPDDVFVFFVASHGTVDEGEYFLITSNVGSTRTEKLKTDALSQGMLKELIANIPATKKLIIIDTCSAGALGEAIQVAMLTRGMSEDTAMKILSRAVGSTILSASTSLQEAIEGYQGHGLFTYVLVEGLKGKADKGKTGYVKTTELADYVDNEVPVLAEKVFKKAQYPTISISGQAFPIGKAK